MVCEYPASWELLLRCRLGEPVLLELGTIVSAASFYRGRGFMGRKRCWMEELEWGRGLETWGKREKHRRRLANLSAKNEQYNIKWRVFGRIEKLNVHKSLFSFKSTILITVKLIFPMQQPTEHQKMVRATINTESLFFPFQTCSCFVFSARSPQTLCVLDFWKILVFPQSESVSMNSPLKKNKKQPLASAEKAHFNLRYSHRVHSCFTPWGFSAHFELVTTASKRKLFLEKTLFIYIYIHISIHIQLEYPGQVFSDAAQGRYGVQWTSDIIW